MITITNSIFKARGANKKDKVYGITLSGKEDVLIQDSVFENIGYASIMNHCEGKVVVDNCEFRTGNVYNPIEGSQKVDNDDVKVMNSKFVGVPGNNYINFYQVKDGSVHTISNCEFEPSVNNNSLRLSNRTNANAKFILEDCVFNYGEGEATEYTGLILCQDYTNKSGVKQDFTKYEIELKNIAEPEKGVIYYVYDDKDGIITGQGNDPVVKM